MKVTMTRGVAGNLCLKFVAETESDRVVLREFVGPKAKQYQELPMSMAVDTYSSGIGDDMLGPSGVSLAVVQPEEAVSG